MKIHLIAHQHRFDRLGLYECLKLFGELFPMHGFVLYFLHGVTSRIPWAGRSYRGRDNDRAGGSDGFRAVALRHR